MEATILHGMATLLDELHSKREISDETLKKKIHEMQTHCKERIQSAQEEIYNYEKLKKYLDTIYDLDKQF